MSLSFFLFICSLSNIYIFICTYIENLSIYIYTVSSIYPFVFSTTFDIYPLWKCSNFTSKKAACYRSCDHRRWPGNIRSTTTSVSCGSFVDKPPKTRQGNGVEWCNVRHTVWRFRITDGLCRNVMIVYNYPLDSDVSAYYICTYYSCCNDVLILICNNYNLV